MSIDIVKTSVNRILKMYGFKKRGNSWYKKSNECTVVFNLQHSLYGKLYYVNMAACFKKDDSDLDYPKEYQCDIRMRLPQTESDEDVSHLALDLDSPLSDNDRETQIECIVEKYCIPILGKLESINGIIALYEEYPELNNKYPLSAILYRKKIMKNDS